MVSALNGSKGEMSATRILAPTATAQHFIRDCPKDYLQRISSEPDTLKVHVPQSE